MTRGPIRGRHSLWGAASSGSAVPLQLAVAQQEVEALEVPLEGAVRIDLEVRRRAPIAAGDVGGEPVGEPADAPGDGTVETTTGGAGTEAGDGASEDSP